MSLILSGTDGLSDVDGSAATPAIRGTDANTGIFFPAADTIAFAEGGAEAMRIDSSGNVGIGTSSPAVKLDVNGITGWGGATTGQTAQIVGASSGIGGGGNFRVLSNTTQAADVGGVLTLGGYYTSTTNSIDFGAILGAKENSTGGNTAGYLAFGTRVNAGNMTERMRIDSSGIVQIGGTTARTTQAKLELTSAANTALSFYMYKTSQVEMAMGFKSSTDTNFYIGTGSSSVGTNGVYLQNTGTSWISNSDERLKENLVPITDAISKVSTLRSVIGNFIADESKTPRPFLIAQDVQQVLPEAIGKSEIDGIEYLGVSYTDTIPLLVAAIKEQQALITALTARITALETP